MPQGGLGLVLYPGGMHRDPWIKPTLNNGQDANSRSVENRHTKEEVDDMWARPADWPHLSAPRVCFALVSSRPF
jgi:hypothetical protein